MREEHRFPKVPADPKADKQKQDGVSCLRAVVDHGGGGEDVGARCALGVAQGRNILRRQAFVERKRVLVAQRTRLGPYNIRIREALGRDQERVGLGAVRDRVLRRVDRLLREAVGDHQDDGEDGGHGDFSRLGGGRRMCQRAGLKD